MVQVGDSPTSPSFDYYHLHSLPAVLDIVWCRFPEAEMPSKPGPKPRPALVRTVKVSRAAPKAMVAVTYGTSNIKEYERPFDLIVANCTDMNAAGLPQATRFDLDRTVWLPWAREFFVPREGHKDPRIGSLPPNAVTQLQVLIVQRRALASRRAQRGE